MPNNCVPRAQSILSKSALRIANRMQTPSFAGIMPRSMLMQTKALMTMPRRLNFRQKLELGASRNAFRRLTGGSGGNGGPPASASGAKTFWQRWTEHKEIPERWTFWWGVEMAYLCCIFGVTGTSTMYFVRPAVATMLQLDGNMRDGPWAYRIGTIFIMFPVYPILLLTFGTLAGRHTYFRFFSVKMLSRFGIPKGRIDPSYRGVGAERAKQMDKNFRKW